MGSTKSLLVLIIASMACFSSLTANAEDEHAQKHERKHEASVQPRAPSRDQGPTITQPQAPYRDQRPVTTQPHAPQQDRTPWGIVHPQAPERRFENNDGQSENPVSILFELLDSISDTSSTTKPEPMHYAAVAPYSFSDLNAALDKNGILFYWGAGAGKSMANYASNSAFAWNVYFGGRDKYFGGELGYNNLGAISTTINSQTADVSTETLSLSLLGYIPMGNSADIFVKFGGVVWNANVINSSTSNLPALNGTGQVYGGGVEIRSSEYLLRFEREIFKNLYQSNFYTFTGISLGAYF